MVGVVWTNHSNKVLQKFREKEKNRIWSPSQREMNIVGEYRKDERERERERGTCLCLLGWSSFWCLCLQPFVEQRLHVCLCSERVMLLNAHLWLSLFYTHTHTHTHAVTRSPSEPHSWRAVASSVRLNHPLLPHFHPHFSLRPLLLPHSSSLSCFVLISLSLCENFMIQLMADEFPLIASSFLSKTVTSYPETAACKYSACVCVCVCVIFTNHTLLLLHVLQLCFLFRLVIFL